MIFWKSSPITIFPNKPKDYYYQKMTRLIYSGKLSACLIGMPLQILSSTAKIKALPGGANSRCFKISAENGQFLLKIYSPGHDGRVRLQREYTACKFLEKTGVNNVPRAFYRDLNTPAALYSFVSGTKITGRKVDRRHISEAAAFLKQLKKLSKYPGAAKIGPAGAACLTVRAIIKNLQQRRQKLEKSTDTKLKEFLRDRFSPAFQTVVTNLEKIKEPAERTLSPSDFGFHNAVRVEDGKLYFIDLEHFGWDDPAKMIADFLLHPQMRLSRELKEFFLRQLLPAFGKDLNLRLKTVYPLFALKWSLIMLNEFTSE